MTPHPEWQVHQSADYDTRMRSRCASLLEAIQTDGAVRASILADSRKLHSELFADFASPSHAEYAGTYRGTEGTSLEHRAIVAASQLEEGKTYSFVPADRVAERMTALLDHLAQWLTDASSDREKLLGLSYVFCWFGKIHPFLDGNGHVQRAIFAAMAIEFGFPSPHGLAFIPGLTTACSPSRSSCSPGPPRRRGCGAGTRRRISGLLSRGPLSRTARKPARSFTLSVDAGEE